MNRLLMLILLISNVVYANESQQLIIKPGTQALQADLERQISETRYRTEIVPKTCTRQEAYDEYVCRNVTRYRDEVRHKTCYRNESYTDRECRNEPRSRRKCRTENERVCRTENERVCRNESERVCRNESQKVCRNIPTTKKVCTNLPSKKVCRTVNGKKVCSNTPGGRKCRDVTHNRKECTTKNKRVCENKPKRVCTNRPKQVCSNKPKQVCRTESYTERVCRNVTRNRKVSYDCSTTERVPYTDRVCENETRYRDVDYDCSYEEQVPYTVKIPHTAQVDIEIKGQSKEEHQVEVLINKKGIVELKQKNQTKKQLEILNQDVQSEKKGKTIVLKVKIEAGLVLISKKKFDEIIFTDPDYMAEEEQLTLNVGPAFKLLAPHIVELSFKDGEVISSFNVLKEDIGENQIFLPLKKEIVDQVNSGQVLLVKVSRDLSKVVSPFPLTLSKTFEFSSIEMK